MVHYFKGGDTCGFIFGVFPNLWLLLLEAHFDSRTYILGSITNKVLRATILLFVKIIILCLPLIVGLPLTYGKWIVYALTLIMYSLLKATVSLHTLGGKKKWCVSNESSLKLVQDYIFIMLLNSTWNWLHYACLRMINRWTNELESICLRKLLYLSLVC